VIFGRFMHHLEDPTALLLNDRPEQPLAPPLIRLIFASGAGYGGNAKFPRFVDDVVIEP